MLIWAGDMGCSAAQAYRCVLWEDLLGNIHLPSFVQKLLPHRWGAAIVTVHSAPINHCHLWGSLPQAGMDAHIQDLPVRLLGQQSSAAMQQQAGRDSSFSCFHCLRCCRAIEDSTGKHTCREGEIRRILWGGRRSIHTSHSLYSDLRQMQTCSSRSKPHVRGVVQERDDSTTFSTGIP